MPGNDFTEVSFYIVPHADDWQIFMFPNVFYDLAASHSKVVFIITTAGDAGFDEKFWTAREEGTKSSLLFYLAPQGNISHSEGVKVFNGHSIKYWCAGNATFYFLRLPDGNLDGGGFSATSFQSISKLKRGEIDVITAIDNSTTYAGWPDLSNTLEAIVLAESNGIAERWINYFNPDTTINRNDHPDHIATGQAVQCINVTAQTNQALYVGYELCNKPNKLSDTEFFWKTGMFAAYEKVVWDKSHYSTLREDVNIYVNWCLKSAEFIIKNLHR